MKILILGDVHLPFTNWEAVAHAAEYAKYYKPDLIVQLGDLIDGYNWSLFKRAVDSPNASVEWENTAESLHRLRGYFSKKIPWKVIEGNHCRRYMLRAAEVNLPKQLIKTLDFMFPFENFTWHMEMEPLVIDNTAFIHGDEMPGNAWQKAQKLGMSVIQGHDHQAYLQYINTFKQQTFGMSVGWLGDAKSLAARYAAKNPNRCFLGFGTLDYGRPALHPFRM